MRFNTDWLAHISQLFGQLDSLKIYEGALPATVGAIGVVGDLTTLTHQTGGFSTGSLNYIQEIRCNDDWSSLWVLDTVNGTIHQVNMTIPGDLSTFSVGVSTLHGNSIAMGFDFNSDYSKIFTVGFGDNLLRQATLSTPGDLSTIGAFTTLDLSAQVIGASSVTFSPDDSKMFVMDSSYNTVFAYTVTTPGNPVGGVTYDGSFDLTTLGAAGASFNALAINSQGTMYVLEQTNNEVYEVSMSAFDITTAAATGNAFTDPTNLFTNIGGLDVKTSDDRIIMANYSSFWVEEFTLAVTGNATLLADFTSAISADVSNSFTATQNVNDVDMDWDGSAVNATVSANGTMGFFLAQVSNGAASFMLDGSVSANGGGGDLQFTTDVVASGDILTLNTISLKLKDVQA